MVYSIYKDLSTELLISSTNRIYSELTKNYQKQNLYTMYHNLLLYILSKLTNYFNLELILSQYTIMIGLQIYNEIKWNGWYPHAETFTSEYTIDKESKQLQQKVSET